MVGKVPSLQPSITGLRHKGSLHIYWSPFFQTYIARSWPKGNGKDSPKRAASRATFTNAVQLLKNADPQEGSAAAELAINTPFLQRDIQMMAVAGRLATVTMQDGSTWVSARMASLSIQQMLDSISATPFSILVRGEDAWLALLPGVSGQVLTSGGPDEAPDWAAGGGGGGGFTPVLQYEAVAGGATIVIGATTTTLIMDAPGGSTLTIDMPTAPPDGWPLRLQAINYIGQLNQTLGAGQSYAGQTIFGGSGSGLNPHTYCDLVWSAANATWYGAVPI